MSYRFQKPVLGLFLFLFGSVAWAQTGRFQQAVDYQMEVSMDV
ncbi:MAG: Aminopeptidase N, partial [Algoriphagus marincola HL-49]